jgi:hypothetical protein
MEKRDFVQPERSNGPEVLREGMAKEPRAMEAFDHRRYRPLTAGEKTMEVWDYQSPQEKNIKEVFAHAYDILTQSIHDEAGASIHQIKIACFVCVDALRNRRY